jgi:hypothetical protein
MQEILKENKKSLISQTLFQGFMYFRLSTFRINDSLIDALLDSLDLA